MTDAMEVLFNYAQEWLEKPLLLAEPEYESVLRRVDSQEQRLQAMLSDEGKELLDHLISERNYLLSFHQQAMFRAGFRLALELGR
ncbi:MAG: hypothetical protein K2M15_02165 [Oscillospiraceae bacterium]|nr:hypothetical protein [Oscillospiraceae bacterium]MDE7170773.1 hypothetical protein [Oscillospiraceae bacterium]